MEQRKGGQWALTELYVGVHVPSNLICTRSGTHGRYMIWAFLSVWSRKRQHGLVSYFKCTPVSKQIQDDWVLDQWQYILARSVKKRNFMRSWEQGWLIPEFNRHPKLLVWSELVHQTIASSEFWSKKWPHRAFNSIKLILLWKGHAPILPRCCEL